MRQLTTGEHRRGQATTEELLARIDALENALSLKEGCYSPHRIAVDNHWLVTRNNELEAELARLREQTQWRPIETAPKRQPVLVMCEGGQSCVLYQTDNGDGYIDTWRWQNGTAFGRWPVKWLPLPPQENERE
jgi:hypothetical protein